MKTYYKINFTFLNITAENVKLHMWLTFVTLIILLLAVHIGELCTDFHEDQRKQCGILFVQDITPKIYI